MARGLSLWCWAPVAPIPPKAECFTNGVAAGPEDDPEPLKFEFAFAPDLGHVVSIDDWYSAHFANRQSRKMALGFVGCVIAGFWCVFWRETAVCPQDASHPTVVTAAGFDTFSALPVVMQWLWYLCSALALALYYAIFNVTSPAHDPGFLSVDGTDIGYLTRAPLEITPLEYDTRFVRVPLELRESCNHCGPARPLRSKHCRSCGRCVPKFDHHCVWLGTCIGSRNYAAFYWLVVTMGYAVCLGSWPIIRSLGRPLTDCPGISHNDDTFGYAARWVWHNGFPLATLCCSIPISLMMVSLFCFHTYGILYNITTYEHARPGKASYLGYSRLPSKLKPWQEGGRCRRPANPFDDGPVGNLEAVLGSLQPLRQVASALLCQRRPGQHPPLRPANPDTAIAFWRDGVNFFVNGTAVVAEADDAQTTEDPAQPQEV